MAPVPTADSTERSLKTLCYCKTRNLSLKPYNLSYNNEMLEFFKVRKDEATRHKLDFKHDIHEFHVRLGPPETSEKNGTTYFPVALFLHSGFLRVLYFMNKEVQTEQYCKILKLQGFNTPLD